MLSSHYLIFKNIYVVHCFNYGMLFCVTISTSSCYVPMIEFMGKNKDDDDDDNTQAVHLAGGKNILNSCKIMKLHYVYVLSYQYIALLPIVLIK
jgi:hypothetical protein